MEFGIPVVVILLFLVFVILLFNSFRRSRSTASLYAGIAADAGDPGNSWNDSWEGAFWEAENPQTVSTDLVINYIDGAGYASERAIRVCEFDNDLYDGILIAHCHLRDAMRTFRFNRIASCRESGSDRPVEDIAAYLTALSKVQTESSPQATDLTSS